MILHAIELTHVGPFRETMRVGPFSRGLNILAAANEAGKSTTLKAATRALFDKHTTRDAEIKAFKPAGTDLAPRIAVEFETAAGRFRVEKTFLQSPRSQLSGWQSNTWRLLAEGDQADQRVQALLQSTLPGRGATGPAHWGFLGFLWARQGEPSEWPRLDDAETGQKIRQRLARVEIDPITDQLRNRLATLADAVITSSGQPKAGGPLRQAEDDLAAITAELTRLAQTRAQLDAQHKLYRDATAEVSRLETEHADAQKKAAELVQLAQSVERLRAELDARQAEFASAREKLQAVATDVESLAQRRAKLATVLTASTAAETTARAADATLAKLRAQIDEAQRQQPDLDTQLTSLRNARQRTQTLLQLRQSRRETATLEKQALRAGEAQDQRTEILGRRSRLPDVTPARLRRLEELTDSIRTLDAQVQALGLTVELTPERDATFLVNPAAASSPESLTAGATRILRSPQSLDLHLTGWGRLVVRSGAREAQEFTTELTARTAALREALLEAQVSSLDTAREALASRKELDGQLKIAEATLTAQLGDHGSVAALREAVATAQKRSQALEAALQPTAAEQETATAQLESDDERLGAAIHSAEKATKTLVANLAQQRREERASLEATQKAAQQLNDLRARQRTLEAQIADLGTRYSAGLDAAKAQAQQTFVETEARLAATRVKLPPEFEKLSERNRRAAAALQQLADELKTRREARDKARGALETLGGQGLYSRETELLEKREEALLRRDAARSRGWSARIAHDLIEYRKQAATKAVLAPLENRLSQAFVEITGETGRNVYLDEMLQIAGLGRTREETYPFEFLSQGAKEQLLLCLRIAVAQELTANEPQVLILDDVLVNTDRTRQDRILDVLVSVAGQTQIVVLTCHPDRYRGIGQRLELTAAP